ncbi:hypothetical protein FA13DRAFT_1614423, partial [Coprinellus micaceus]
AGSATRQACTLCLGRHPHDIYKCAAAILWDGSPAHCRRNSKNRLQDDSGQELCSNWQTSHGCDDKTHDSKHSCSGCGRKDHGAQGCSRAQK